MAKSTYVTKWDAGGSGDNIVPDGFIKTVEKVWLDTYVYSSASTIGSGLVIECAVIPQGKKITGIEVYGIGALSATSTNTISIGTKMMGFVAGGTVGTVTNATLFLAATTYGTSSWNFFQKLEAISGLYTELTSGQNRITLQFGAASPSVTGGTITTKVRWV